jgi:hypothetical protein
VLLPLCVGLSLSVPLVACVPVQAPLAVQEVAFVEDHVNVACSPTVMVVGATERVTVGDEDEAAPGGSFATKAFTPWPFAALFAGWNGFTVGKSSEKV